MLYLKIGISFQNSNWVASRVMGENEKLETEGSGDFNDLADGEVMMFFGKIAMSL